MTTRGIALYHEIRRNEGFEESAQILFTMLRQAIGIADGPRRLYLDIEGHRNRAGGFDDDMLELQKEFLLGFLGPYLTEISMPLGRYRNPGSQRNDLPDELQISSP